MSKSLSHQDSVLLGARSHKVSPLNPSLPVLLVFSRAHWLLSVTAAHSPQERDHILRQCWDPRTPIPVDQIRDYYGEEVAFYFGGFSSWSHWLRVPAVAGVAVYAHRSYAGHTVATCEWTPFLES